MIENIRNVFSEMVNESQWMDSTSKSAAIDKVGSMKEQFHLILVHFCRSMELIKELVIPMVWIRTPINWIESTKMYFIN